MRLRTQRVPVRSFESEPPATSDSACNSSRFCVRTQASFGLSRHLFAVLGPNPSQLRTQPASVRGFGSELRPTSDSAGIRFQFWVRTPANFGLSRHPFAVLGPNSSQLRTQRASVRGFVSEPQPASDSACNSSRFCVRTQASFGLSLHPFAVLCPNSSQLQTQPASLLGPNPSQLRTQPASLLRLNPTPKRTTTRHKQSPNQNWGKPHKTLHLKS